MLTGSIADIPLAVASLADIALGLLLLSGVVLVVAVLDAILPAGRAEPMGRLRLVRTTDPEEPPRAYGFPVVAQPALPVREGEDGPGWYRVIGVVRETGEDIDLRVDAMTMANAKVKAELKGVIVTQVRKDVDAGDGPPEPRGEGAEI